MLTIKFHFLIILLFELSFLKTIFHPAILISIRFFPFFFFLFFLALLESNVSVTPECIDMARIFYKACMGVDEIDVNKTEYVFFFVLTFLKYIIIEFGEYFKI